MLVFFQILIIHVGTQVQRDVITTSEFIIIACQQSIPPFALLEFHQSQEIKPALFRKRDNIGMGFDVLLYVCFPGKF